MKRKVYNYTWEDFECDVDELEFLIHMKFDSIVAISRGGLVLGTKLSNLLGTPLRIIEANSYKEKRRKRLVVEQFHPLMWGKKVLLVDDISDSGQTLLEIKERLEVWGKEVFILTLFKRNSSKCIPDKYVRTVYNNDWVKFPWE